jgi:hypothetical protein
MSAYHPTIHTNIHDVTSIHVREKGHVWKDEHGNPAEGFDPILTTDILITMSSGQEIKITTFHQPGLVPTFSSVDQERAAEADPIPTTQEVTTS